ncbi:MAG: hypothetical protein M1836_000121 [Candelina mexicana]|nr:MAG: hypothetical protein M1836_000121 [Candelina mexicana]
MSIAHSYRRATLTTYSSQAKRVLVDDEEPAPKKRRIEYLKHGIRRGSAVQDESQVLPSRDTTPSSPARELSAVFSSDPPEEAYDTPPSSPPPRQPSPRARAKRQPLSICRRPIASTTTSNPFRPPLTNTAANAPKPAVPKKSNKARPLKQMQIDLGGEIQKTCKVCGMDYIPSNVEDATLHKKFHALNVGGVDFGKSFIKDHSIMKHAQSRNSNGQEVGGGGCILIVDRKSSLAAKNKAKRVLEVVNTELSAINIDDERLWGHVMASRLTEYGPVAAKASQAAPAGHEAHFKKEQRFRFYLYLEGEKCVGLCLAERIKEAYKVIDGTGELLEPSTTLALSTSSSISISKQSDSAVLGISRIWVSVSHRRRGIALALLDGAAKDFVYGMTIPKELIAFSQPTESGGRLARRWFGDSKHWRVYLEQ